MFGNDRLQMRRFFIDAWTKFRDNQPLEPIEQMIVETIRQHPEYHSELESSEKLLEHDFSPEEGRTNLFLHLSMHISITEQISTDRPAGIAGLYRELSLKTGDRHEAEHRMMECLGRMLWEAQRNNRMPDETDYLACVQKLI